MAFSNGILHSQASPSVTFSFLKSAIHLVWSVFGMTHFEEMESQTSTTTIIVVLLFLCFLVLSVIMLVNILVALLTATYDKYKVCFNQSSNYIYDQKRKMLLYISVTMILRLFFAPLDLSLSFIWNHSNEEAYLLSLLLIVRFHR